jgi:hypothetical protein
MRIQLRRAAAAWKTRPDVFGLATMNPSGAARPADLQGAVAWVIATRRDLEGCLRAEGAVLVRGLPLRSAHDFDAIVGAMGVTPFSYAESLSNAVRISRTGRVVTANEAPPSVTIHLHHELAQTPVVPSQIVFFCEHPAARGGATSLCRSDLLYQRLVREMPAFVERCERAGLRYTTVMPAENDPSSGVGRSWRSTFGVATAAQAEERMQRLGYGWQWLPDGTLRATTPVLPAVRALGGGRKSFFNQLIAVVAGWRDARNDPSRAVAHGDGTPVDLEAVRAATAVAEELAVDVAWQTGDMLLVDNYVVMHGRRSFEGPRSVLVSLVRGEA